MNTIQRGVNHEGNFLKKSIHFYTCLFVCLLVISCVSLPEPDSKNQTLVVGIANIQDNYHPSDSSSRAGIEITLNKFSGTGGYTLVTNADGIFYSAKIPGGIYKLSEVKYPSGNVIFILDSPPKIEIENGKVNNLGTFTLIGTSGVGGPLNWSSGYEQVRFLFGQKYSSSNWNQKEWINIRF